VHAIGLGLLIAALALTLAHAQTTTPAAPDASRPSFSAWLAELREEALSRGIREEVVAEAFASIDEPLAVVLERDRSQAETVLPLETYISRQVAAARIRTGRQMFQRHQDLLGRIADAYGVPGRVVVAIWGLESNFGRFTGVRPTIASLTTLAWDPRRSTLFRSELFNALEILNRGDIGAADMRGSWAGAMGQPQFMPSSYLRFAEDFDGDGKRNIWASPADVFASIANFLRGSGWVEGERWGREVVVSPDAARAVAAEVARRDGRCRAMRDMSAAIPLAEWQRLGVRLQDNAALPSADVDASLVSGSSRHFLVYRNYNALLEYNCAHAYALSVALLSDRL
jgi:membrane-bound lytic murein transglycosylase B